MKIRNGFVSNSSSTSFCVFGIVTEGEYDEDLEDKLWRNREIPLDYQRGCEEYYDRYLIGCHPGEIKDDETFAQFRERIANLIAEVTGKAVDPNSLDYHIDGGYDG